MKFTLQELEKSEFNINIDDCQALFNYSQVLYELQRYKDADKYLVSLKEILANESANHNALVTQVFCTFKINALGPLVVNGLEMVTTDTKGKVLIIKYGAL